MYSVGASTPWSVYLARCRDGSLYAGVTTNPVRRLAQHNAGRGAAYTRSRTPVTLVYCEPARDRSAALRRERALRRLTRAEKEALIAGLPMACPALEPGVTSSAGCPALDAAIAG